MAWYDDKSPAVDPDNPTADEQITAAEWNAMRLEMRNRLIGRDVDDTNLADTRILVYDLASDTFVFEDQTTISELNDIPNVIISGVPADNEVFAYDYGTSKWINQTAAEAGLATVAGLAAYYPLTGGTMAGAMNMGGQGISGANQVQAYDAAGVRYTTNLAVTKINLAYDPYAFQAHADADMNSNRLLNVLDPTSAQHASTKNYDDTHLFTKEAVTSFTDGYIPVYRTASGKFEMEAGGGSAGLPVADTTSIVKGSADGTKLLRFEVDGFTSGITRVATFPDKNFTVCGTDEVMLLSGANAMAGAINMNGQQINNVGSEIDREGNNNTLVLEGGQLNAAQIWAYGKDSGAYPGSLRFWVTDAAKTAYKEAIYIAGVTDTPYVTIKHGLDMNVKNIDDIGALILNDATELTIDAVGQVTATQSFHTIDTYGDGATDDLDSIAGGTAGQILVITAADSARTVVAKNGAENLILEGDMTLDNVNDTLTMIFTGVSWFELSRSNNGA